MWAISTVATKPLIPLYQPMKSAHTPLVPRIAGEWQLLYKPEKTGCYVNDHTLIRGLDGNWHLFGITRKSLEGSTNDERYFTYGRSNRLLSPHGLEEVQIVCDDGVRAWAPSVVTDGKRYYMHYGPSPMRMATSDELTHWIGHTPVLHDAPLESCHRDSMVLKLADGPWLMYATGLKDRRGVISVFESQDLVNWTFLRYALRTSGNAPLNPPWGATESPFVVEMDGWFYLFVTYTDCSRENYHNTLVFRSQDPIDFGEYTGDNHDEVVITTLHAHAPEIAFDDGRWFITTCGWRNFGVPIEGAVAIAELQWG